MNVSDIQMISASPAHGLRHVFALPHRTDVLLNEQLCLVQDSQANLERALNALEEAENNDERERQLDQVNVLKSRTDELIVLLQVLVKIRTELAHTMRDLDRARKSGEQTKSLQKRVQWLENRLERLLLSRKKARRTRTRPVLTEPRRPLAESHLSDEYVERLERRSSKLFEKIDDEEEEEEEEEDSDWSTESDTESSKSSSTTTTTRRENEDRSVVIAADSPLRNRSVSSTETDTLPVTSKLVAQYGALVTARRTRDQPQPPFLPDRHDDADTMTELKRAGFYRRSPPRPLSRPPTLHTQYEFTEGVGIEDPLSWHQLGLPLQSSYIARRSASTSLLWGARTRRLMKRHDPIEEKIEVERTEFGKLARKIDKIHDYVENTVDDLATGQSRADRRMARIFQPSNPIPSTVSPATVNAPVNDVHAAVYAAVPPLCLPRLDDGGGGGTRHLVTDRSRSFPAPPSRWTGDAKASELKAKRIVADVSAVGLSGGGFKAREMSRSKTRRKTFSASAAGLRNRDRAGKNDMFSQKQKRVEDLIQYQLTSSLATTRRDAAKSLGLLGWKDDEILTALKRTVSSEDDYLVQLEASRSLLLLEAWDVEAMIVAAFALRRGTQELRLDLLTVLATSLKHSKPCDDDEGVQETFRTLCTEIVSLMSSRFDARVAFQAAVVACYATDAIPPTTATEAQRLIHSTLENDSLPTVKLTALEALVEQLHCYPDEVIDAVVNLLRSAFSGKIRASAARLLAHVSRAALSRYYNAGELHETLEKKLWDDPSEEVRVAVSDTLTAMGKRREICQKLVKQLEDVDDNVRAQAVTALGTVGIENVQQLRLILDLLELDSSVHVRIQAARALSRAEIAGSNSKVVRVLKERAEKSDGVLAREAKKALKKLMITS